MQKLHEIATKLNKILERKSQAQFITILEILKVR